MVNRITAMGTLLLIGAVFLSLNALAVSARPGDGIQDEKTTAIAVATSTLPEASASGTVAPTGGVVAVPVPPPTLNPTLIGSSRNVAMQPATNPIQDPTVARSGDRTPDRERPAGQDIPTGPGIYPPSPGSTAPVLPGNGMIQPGTTPVPIPPDMGKVTPVPIPPYSVDPVHECL